MAYGRGVGLLRHRRSNKRSKISRVGRHFPRVPPRESFFFLFSFITWTGEVAAATELDYIDTDYNTIQNTMSDNRRSPTSSTPRSSGKGPVTRSSTARGARARNRAQPSAHAGPGKSHKGKGKPSDAALGSDEPLRAPYTATETQLSGLGAPASRTPARGAVVYAKNEADESSHDSRPASG